MPDSTPTRPPQANRRASRRVRVGGGARLECRRGSCGLGPDLTLAVHDLSETGVCLVLKLPAKRGQEVELVIHGAGLARPLRRIGRVVWAVPAEDGCRVGIHFSKPLAYMDVQAVAAPPRVLR